MYCVYILRLIGIVDKKFYIGYTHNLKQRLRQHVGGQVHTTKNKQPKLIYFEAYSVEERAQEREKKLKEFGSAYSGLMKRLG